MSSKNSNSCEKVEEFISNVLEEAAGAAARFERRRSTQKSTTNPFIYTAAHKIYFILAWPFLLNYEYIMMRLTDGVAQILMSIGVISALRGLLISKKKAAAHPGYLRGITQPYQLLYKCAIDGYEDGFFNILESAAANINENPLLQLSPSLHNTFLHIAVSFGHEALAKRMVESHNALLLQINFEGDTALHVAAKAGRNDMVKCLVKLAKEQQQRNASNLNAGDEGGDGDIENGVAANLHAGVEGGEGDNENVDAANPNVGDEGGEKGDIKNGHTLLLLRMINNEGNTALHEALINGHPSVADYLIEQDPQVSYWANKEEKSPLYLATEGALVETVKLIAAQNNIINVDKVGEAEAERLRMIVFAAKDTDDQYMPHPINFDVQGKFPLHAAILGRNKEVLETISIMGFNINIRDEKGRTPLHYAAAIGFLEGVHFLLRYCPSDAQQPDNSGTYPIHSAASKDHVDIVRELLQHCPASSELLQNLEGQNMLHVAAKWGKHHVVNYILRKGDDFHMLINHKDRNGNTPLHLATIHRHPRSVKYLTWDGRANLNLLNNNGMTALDIAESTMLGIASFHGRLTWVALKSAGAERAHRVHVLRRKKESDSLQNVVESKDRQVTTDGEDVDEIINSCKADCMELQLPNKKSYKDRVNTLLVVTTLVATVTFAAGFTMPGGYNNSGPRDGKAILLTQLMFQVFVICNTMAMYSSVLVAVTLIWAQLGDIILVFTALRLVMPLLGIALTMFSLAFMAGVYVVVSNLCWLATFVLAIGVLFLYTVLILFIPLFLPTRRRPTFRYITYYPFYLLALLAAGSHNHDQEEE